MPLGVDGTLRAMALLAGVAVCVNAAELLVRRRDPVLRAITEGAALDAERGALAPLLRPQVFTVLLVLQAIAGVAMIARGASAWAAVAFVTTVLTAVRWRGRVNGGADAMLALVLLALAIAPFGGMRLREGAVLLVAAQVTLSYLRAGLAKARASGWWQGTALPAFVALPAYGAPVRFAAGGLAARLLGAGTIIAECLAPLAWTGPRAALVVVTIAVAFHAGVAWVFGLNRFVFAWGAALPALLHAGQRAA
ncbi:MAG: hypothetical protein MUF21_11230 [Gemmatimonadaceae bacterium]|jgi:hypothetical protein|nr:hypothetical protein [Gemmatimonadaceae bacterium]